ncbi:MAG: YdcF family protein [Myxococcales bacterium]|nr:YdcF family protein [Myxococcales bacterium]
MISLVLAAALAWSVAAIWLDARGHRPAPPGPYDAIVVPGCRVMPDGRPSGALARRVRRAVALYHDGAAPRIVLTGGLGDGPITEAEAAARMCQGLGVEERALVREGASTTTYENAAFAARLVSGRVLVVTDSYHAFRCQRMFRRFFEDAEAVGVTPPTRSRWRHAFREVLSVVKHAVAGRL